LRECLLEPVCAGTGKYAAIHANLPGGQVFQNAGGRVMGALQDLYTALQTGNNITGTVTEIDNALKQVDAVTTNFAQAQTASQATVNATARVLVCLRCSVI
jgi:hypothetical protein